MWKCSRCGENLKDSFEVCWSCGTDKQGALDPNFLDPETGVFEEEDETSQQALGEREAEPGPMVTIAECNLATEAYLMRGRLEAEGIPVFLADELTLGTIRPYAAGGIKVQVPADEAPRASELIAEIGRTAQRDAGEDEPEGS